MIFKDRDKTLTVKCDECRTNYPTGEANFRAAVEASKEAGFKSVNVDGEWKHFCEECREEYVMSKVQEGDPDA
jgi:hypothetical protein